MNKIHGLSLIYICISSLSFGMTSSSSLSSSQADDSIYVLGESSKEEDSGLIDAPVKVEVLSAKDIEQSHYKDLSQAISDIPGVVETSVSRRAGAKSALIQGFGENSVLVMIDGTPAAQNSSFGFDLAQVSTEDIEKVEVIKGGASALYGSAAIGGVINIVTKKPTAKSIASIDMSSGVAASGQSAKSNNISALYSGVSSSIGQKFSISYRNQDSYDLDPSSIVEDGTSFDKFNASAYLDKSYGKNTTYINYSAFKGESESKSSKPFGSSAFGAIINNTQTHTQNFKIGHNYKLQDGSLKAILNYETTQDELKLNDNPLTEFVETFKKTQYDTKRAELIYDDLVFESHSLTAGLLYKEELVDQRTVTQQTQEIIVKTNDITDKKIWAVEGFVQDNTFLGDFEVSPGARLQYDSSYGSQITPKLNISYYKDINANLTSKTWATIGTGYRAPSIKERFFTLDHTSVANYIVQGNDNLSPEKSVSLQLGEELRFKRKQSIHANLFYNRVRNLIETTEIESDTSTRIFSYKNYDEVSSHGLELGSQYLFSNKYKLNLNYTYSKTLNEATKLVLVNRPLYTANVKFTYTPIDSLNLISSLKYQGSKYTSDDNTEYLPSYITLDLKANYTLNKNINLYLGINNILDETKQAAKDSVVVVSDDRPSLGRYIFTGLKVRTF